MRAVVQDGEPLDALCWRTLGFTAGVTEQVLALNPGLAALGGLLPEGTEVDLPEVADVAQPVRETVQLWD